MDFGIMAIPELPQLDKNAAKVEEMMVRKTGRENMLQGSGDWQNGWWVFLEKLQRQFSNSRLKRLWQTENSNVRAILRQL